MRTQHQKKNSKTQTGKSTKNSCKNQSNQHKIRQDPQRAKWAVNHSTKTIKYDHASWKMTKLKMTLNPHQNQMRKNYDPTCHHPAGCHCYPNDLLLEEELLLFHLLLAGTWEHTSLELGLLQLQLEQQYQDQLDGQEAHKASELVQQVCPTMLPSSPSQPFLQFL